MKLWIAPFLSLILAAAAVVFGPPAAARLFSIGTALFPSPADLGGAGTIFVGVLVGAVVYSTAATALLTLVLIVDVAGARDILLIASNSGQHLLRRDWETAFSSESLRPARYRVVAQLTHPEDEHLLLAAPFAPRQARAEFRAIYSHRLAIAQVWSLVCALMLCVLLVPLFSAEETALALTRPAILGLATVIAIIGVAWMAMSIAVDRLISVLAEAPLLVKSSLAIRFDSPTERAAESEHLANAIAANMQSRIEAIVVNLDDLCSAALERNLATRLPGLVVATISNALESCFENARPTVERISAAGDNLRLELPVRIAEALQSDLRRISTEQIEERRLASESIIAEQRAIGEKADELRRIITDQHDLELDVLRQLATELSQLGPGLMAVLRETSGDAAEERGRDARRTIELMQSIQAYAGSLLPAIKRLESYDERVLRAMNQESETLSQLTTSLNELSGTLEVLRVQLSHPTVTVPANSVQPGPSSLQTSAHRLENGQSNMSGLAAELRSLLEDLDEERRSQG